MHRRSGLVIVLFVLAACGSPPVAVQPSPSPHPSPRPSPRPTITPTVAAVVSIDGAYYNAPTLTAIAQMSDGPGDAPIAVVTDTTIPTDRPEVRTALALATQIARATATPVAPPTAAPPTIAASPTPDEQAQVDAYIQRIQPYIDDYNRARTRVADLAGKSSQDSSAFLSPAWKQAMTLALDDMNDALNELVTIKPVPVPLESAHDLMTKIASEADIFRRQTKEAIDDIDADKMTSAAGHVLKIDGWIHTWTNNVKRVQRDAAAGTSSVATVPTDTPEPSASILPTTGSTPTDSVAPVDPAIEATSSAIETTTAPPDAGQQSSSAYTLSGQDDQLSPSFTLNPGLYLADGHYSGDGNFSIWLKNANGEDVALLANVVGSADTVKAFYVKTSQPFVMSIESSGTWNIKLRQPSMDEISGGQVAPTSLSGHGDQTIFIKLPAGLNRCEYTYVGPSNFSIWVKDLQGEDIGLAANVVGDSTGSRAVKVPEAGWYYLDLQSEGDWTLKISQ
jgi:hypothetical protein